MDKTQEEEIQSEPEHYEKHWEELKKEAKERYGSTDAEQLKLSREYLQALVYDRSFRGDADKVKRHIYNFKDISKVLVEDCRLND